MRFELPWSARHRRSEESSSELVNLRLRDFYRGPARRAANCFRMCRDPGTIDFLIG